MFSLGEIVVGTVLSLEPTGALVDIGTPTPAHLPLREMSMAPVDTPSKVLQLNETREFRIVASDDEQGRSRFVLSLRSLEEEIVWERLRQMQAEDVTTYSVVFATTDDGVLVKIEGLQGFVPGSHISTRKPREDLVGQELILALLEVDEDRNRLLFSHRRALVGRKMHRIEVGELKIGSVRGIKPYGVFINIIGGISGVLGISDISHEMIENPHTVFKVNDEVKVLIVNLDAERGRISLSTKHLEPQPGDMLKNPQLVYEKAEEIAAKYQEKLWRESGKVYWSDAIKNVTESNLEYVDENGNTQVIDFKVCVQNCLKILKINSPKYVAKRKNFGNLWRTSPYYSHYCIEFFTQPLTRFVFKNKKSFSELRWQIKHREWLILD
ncbi:MAG TPA: S1 RNA-binding domain-containing protein [Oculatellaceae cyanobacterium]